MKHILINSILLGSVFTLSSPAQTSQQNTTPADTILVTSFVETPAVTVTDPILIDQVNLKGEKYNRLSLFRPISVNGELPEGKVISTPDGWISSPKPKEMEPHADRILNHTTGILAERYEKGTLLVESSLPYRAYVDGYPILESNVSKDPSKESMVQSREITLYPSTLHTLTIQRLESGKDTITDSVRVRFVPKKEESTTSFSTDPTRYMSLYGVMSGEFMTGVRLSPTGKYTLVRMKRTYGKESEAYALLYDGHNLIGTLHGGPASGEWLPKSDKLWYSRKSPAGRIVVYYDPTTMTEYEAMGPVPEGDFSISTDEKTLIYSVKEEGAKVGDDVQLMQGRDDRIPGYRDRRSIYLYRDNAYYPVTFGYHNSYVMDISEDGTKMLVGTSREMKEFPFDAMDIEEVDLETMTSRNYFSMDPNVSGAYYTTHPGKLLVAGNANAFGGLGRNLPDSVLANTYDMQLYLYDTATREATPLTRDFDPSIKSITVSPSHCTVYFTADNEDHISLYRLDPESGKIVRIPTTEEVVRGYDVDRNDTKLVYFGQSANNSDRLYEVSMRGRGMNEGLIYDLSAQRLENVKLGTVEDWDHTMPDGTRIQGRYYLPPSFDPAKKYPMIVYYYGGTTPTPRYFEWTYSAPMYAAQGYVVYVLNPGGTIGYGQEFSARHVNAWGKRTADEIIASVKGFCSAHPFVDKEKIGCIGASYGGFMTQYLQTQTDIFAAAVSHAGISSLSSYWGEGFWGVGYGTVASTGSYPWNNRELYTEQSPLFNADKINTPLLLLHGTSDTNVPEGESVQMYNALKVLGKEVEYLRVFGQDHHIVDPDKRVKWTQATFAWFQKWLMDDPTWWDDLFPAQHL